MKMDKQTVAYSKDGIHLEIGSKCGAIDEPHSHSNEYQIEVLFSGTAKNISADNPEVFPGYIDIYNPNDSHQTDYRDTDSFIFSIELNALKKIYSDMNVFQNEPIFNPKINKQCGIPLELLTQELRFLKQLEMVPVSNSIELYKEYKVLNLLKLILHDLEDNKVKHNLKVIDYYSRQKMLEIKEWINENFQRDDIGISNLAELSHLSRFHFIRTFKEVVGQSPYDYLISVRVNAAINIIKNGKYRNIDDVSANVGFKNTAQLRYHVKRLKRLLPSKIII
jgi:AraC-like DNA-binding protein